MQLQLNRYISLFLLPKSQQYTATVSNTAVATANITIEFYMDAVYIYSCSRQALVVEFSFNLRSCLPRVSHFFFTKNNDHLR